MAIRAIVARFLRAELSSNGHPSRRRTHSQRENAEETQRLPAGRKSRLGSTNRRRPEVAERAPSCDGTTDYFLRDCGPVGHRHRATTTVTAGPSSHQGSSDSKKYSQIGVGGSVSSSAISLLGDSMTEMAVATLTIWNGPVPLSIFAALSTRVQFGVGLCLPCRLWSLVCVPLACHFAGDAAVTILYQSTSQVSVA